MRETKRDDIWKYQTSLRAALSLLSLHSSGKINIQLSGEGAFLPLLRARFPYGLACILGYVRTENTRQISENTFLRLGTQELPQPCIGYRLTQLMKILLFLQIWGQAVMCSVAVSWCCKGVLQGFIKSPAFLTSRLSLWEK